LYHDGLTTHFTPHSAGSFHTRHSIRSLPTPAVTMLINVSLATVTLALTLTLCRRAGTVFSACTHCKYPRLHNFNKTNWTDVRFHLPNWKQQTVYKFTC